MVRYPLETVGPHHALLVFGSAASGVQCEILFNGLVLGYLHPTSTYLFNMYQFLTLPAENISMLSSLLFILLRFLQLSNLAFHPRFHGGKLPCRGMQCRALPCRGGFGRIPSHFSPENVCKPGNTLLWDLLQDDKIVSSLIHII